MSKKTVLRSATTSAYKHVRESLLRSLKLFNIAVDLAMRNLVYHICELGWLYRKITAYLAKYRDNLAYGIVSAVHTTHS